MMCLSSPSSPPPPWRPVRIARIYDEPDGTRRVLVDRLWPRGVSKEQAALDHWAKDLAPSDGLRKEYHAGLPWDAFEARYRAELEEADLSVLREGDTLLTAAKTRPCHADVLAAFAARNEASD